MKMIQLPFVLHVKIKGSNSHVPPSSASAKGNRGNTLPHPISIAHALPCTFLAWKRLVTDVKGEEPKLTPGTGQENTLSPSLRPLLSSSDTPGAWYEFTERRVGALVASCRLQDSPLNTYWTTLGKGTYDCPSEEEEAESSRQIAFGSFALKATLGIGADVGEPRCGPRGWPSPCPCTFPAAVPSNPPSPQRSNPLQINQKRVMC